MRDRGVDDDVIVWIFNSATRGNSFCLDEESYILSSKDYESLEKLYDMFSLSYSAICGSSLLNNFSFFKDYADEERLIVWIFSSVY